jgi:glycosyltransferase 2 family protein
VFRFALGFGLAGLTLATGLIAYQGFNVVFAALASAGVGLLWASLFHIVPMTINAHAWQVLLGRSRRPVLAYMTWVTWLRESVNGLLPVARIGGEVLAVRLALQRGVRMGPAVASVVVDMTLGLASQFAYTMVGLVLLVQYSDDLTTRGSILLGLAIGIPVVVAFVVAQRNGLFAMVGKVARALFGERFMALVGGAAALDRSVRVVYRRPARLLWCTVWQFVSYIVAAGEIWLALYFLGHPISVGEAILIDALTHAVSSAAFVVPAAIGVQEGGFMVIGGLLGLTPEIALALALARRARDLILFLPGLLAWQIAEGRKLLATA